MAQRVCVTGASGQAGRAAVRELTGHGYDVVATDAVVARNDRFGMLRADLTDYGQAVEVLSGCDAVVHLANIPAPGMSTPAVTFNANMAMNFNVFQAAASLGLQRVVWASSETTLGLPFDVPPRYAPVDEDHYPVPTTTYALSKVASETVAAQIAQWSGIPFVALPSPTSCRPPTTTVSRRSGRTRGHAGGTCGVTSTSGTGRRRAGSRWKRRRRRWRAAPPSSSRRPTR